MRIFEKVKNVKKRWYVLIIVVLMVGGAVGAYHEKSQARSSRSVSVNEQVFSDLVYLESIPELKLTPEQAKGILPLVSQLTSSQELKTQYDLERQIYGSLNPSQYSTLIEKENDENRLSNNREDKKDHDGEGFKGHNTDNKFANREDFEGEAVLNPKQEALKDIVIKMLQERGGEKVAS